MGPSPHHIPIHAASPVAACGGCVHGAADSGPVCRAVLGQACEAPTLSGPVDALARLLKALAPVLGAPETGGLVRALHVRDGEVELLLALQAGCASALLADSAFQALRGVLPDTDIYVRTSPAA